MSYQAEAEMGKRVRKWSFPPLGCLLPLLLASSLASADFTEAVKKNAEQSVKNYARTQKWTSYTYEVTAWVPASLERLGECAHPVQIAPAQDAGRRWGRVPYVLKCSEPAWEVRGRADVSVKVPVVMASRNISRGETFDPRWLKLEIKDLADVYGDFLTDMDSLAGQRARRAIRGGQIVTLDQATAPFLVERGENVVIRTSVDGVNASMKGEALESGTQGQGIRVRNHSSKKEITAWVVDKGVVETRF
jgi:flagellar basal body P-ring formation protein FlgA